MNLIGEYIVFRRKERGWNMSELARRAYCSKSMLSRVEAGLSEPGFMLLCRVAGAFNQKLGDFLVQGGWTDGAQDAAKNAEIEILRDGRTVAHWIVQRDAWNKNGR